MDPYFEQPRGVLTVLADGFRLAWRTLRGAWYVFLLTVVLYLLAGPIIIALTGQDLRDLGLGASPETEALVDGATAALLLGVFTLLNLFLLLWIVAILIGHMSLLAGAGPEDATRAMTAVRRVPAMLGASLVFGAAVVAVALLSAWLLGGVLGRQTELAAAAIVVLVAVLVMFLWLAPGLAVLERLGPIRAHWRSATLVLSGWSRVLGLMALIVGLNIALTLTLGLIVTVLFYLITPATLSAVLAWAVNPLLGAALVLVGTGMICSLYWDLRARELGDG